MRSARVRKVKLRSPSGISSLVEISASSLLKFARRLVSKPMNQPAMRRKRGQITFAQPQQLGQGVVRELRAELHCEIADGPMDHRAAVAGVGRRVHRIERRKLQN